MRASTNSHAEPKLVSAYTTDKGQVVKDAYVRNPTGFLTYTAAGRMMAIIAGRKPLSANNQVTAPVEERAEASTTIVAYAGRYSVADGKVIHHVEVSVVQNEVNTDKVRTIVKLEGKRVTLRVKRSANHRRISLGADELEFEVSPLSLTADCFCPD